MQTLITILAPLVAMFIAARLVIEVRRDIKTRRAIERRLRRI